MRFKKTRRTSKEEGEETVQEGQLEQEQAGRRNYRRRKKEGKEE